VPLRALSFKVFNYYFLAIGLAFFSFKFTLSRDTALGHNTIIR
jgi:hypothetical protein